MRVSNHKCILTSSGERKREERSWTATCKCGQFEESHSTKEGAAREYRFHLDAMKRRQDAERVAAVNGIPLAAAEASVARDALLAKAAVRLVSELPSLREFLRDDIDVARAAAEIRAEVQAWSAEPDFKIELAAYAMYELRTRVT